MFQKSSLNVALPNFELTSLGFLMKRKEKKVLLLEAIYMGQNILVAEKGYQSILQ